MTLGGVDLREVAQREVRRTMRLAGQDAYLFTATIAQNVRLARPEAGDAAIEAVLRQAGLGRWIDSLPDGIATPVGRGGHRSRGGSDRASPSLACCCPRPAFSSAMSRRPTWIRLVRELSSNIWLR